MQRMLGRRGQSTAEYAVLFAMVIGAAITMQQYVKSRLQGSVKKVADEYATAAGGATPFEPDRTTTSANQSTSNVRMSSARAGAFNVANTASTNSTVTK